MIKAVGLALVLVSTCKSIVFVLTPVNCTVPCQFSQCLNMKSEQGDFEIELCSDLPPRQQESPYKISMGYCRYDIYGNGCPYNMCQFPLKTDCVDQSYLSFLNGDELQRLSIECKSCPSNLKFSKCISTTRKYLNEDIASEVINPLPLGNSFGDCNGLSQGQEFSFFSCPNFTSYNGKKCNWCYRTENLEKIKNGYCMQWMHGHPKKLINYLRGISEANPSNQNQI